MLASSSSSCIRQVPVKERHELSVTLNEKTVLSGSGDKQQLNYAATEAANHAVIFPHEDIARDSMSCRSGIRTADWSPRGVDRFGRCVLSVVTYKGRASILMTKGADTWAEALDLSTVWQNHYIVGGRVPGGYSCFRTQEAISPSKTSVGVPSAPLECKTVGEYLDAAEDMYFSSTCWSQLPRHPQTIPGPGGAKEESVNVKLIQKVINPSLLLVTLKKSGALAFWNMRLPITARSCVSLVLVDYTYATCRKVDTVRLSPRVVFMKLCDLDDTHCLLVLVLSDGSIIGLVHGIQFTPDGSLCLQFVEKLDLSSKAIKHTPVVACAWSIRDGLLCIGYGAFLLVIEIKSVKLVSNGPVRSTPNISSSAYRVYQRALTKPNGPVFGCITGVQVRKPYVYITTVDGYLACWTMGESSGVSNQTWSILWPNKSNESEEVHWELHGLNVSCNGAYICFVECPVNYLDNTRRLDLAVLTPRVRFVSYWTNAKLLEVIFDPKLSVNRKSDALQQLCQRWHDSDGTAKDLRSECLRTMKLMDTETLPSKRLPESWLDQPPELLQVYRLLLELFAADHGSEIKKQASNWLIDLDNLLRDRHFGRCFDLFLQSSIQRQAVDCLLVIRMATKLLDRFACNADTETTDISPSSSARCVLPGLRQTAEKVRTLARQLYVHRFRLPATDLPAETETCPICSDSVIPNLSQSICVNGHSIDRCMHTLEPCTDIPFRACEMCHRIALAIQPQDRLSVWRSAVMHPMCIYCDSLLTWRDL